MKTMTDGIRVLRLPNKHAKWLANFGTWRYTTKNTWRGNGNSYRNRLRSPHRMTQAQRTASTRRG